MPSLYLLGYTVYSDLLVGTDASQERTLDGGSRKAPRYQGLLGCLLRRGRGGPWAPPPRFVNFKVSWFLFCLGIGCLGTSSLIGLLCRFVFWRNLSVTLSPSSFGPFLASLSGTPTTGIVWLFLGHKRFFSSCSGTLSSLLPSLSERYRSGLAGTHTHTHTHTLEERHFLPVRRLPLPLFVVFFSPVLICVFLLPFGSCQRF